MSLMASVQRGRVSKPPRILLYGVEGIGKSTFGSLAPKAIFIQTEDGLDEIDCDKFPLATSYEDVITALAELRGQEHGYETVVIDSLDWLERLVWDHVFVVFHEVARDHQDVFRAHGLMLSSSAALRGKRKVLCQPWVG